MTTYKITQRSQSVMVLEQVDGHQAIECGRMTNTPAGWQAQKVESTARMSSMGPIYAPTGESVRVSHLVNQHDGAAQIATLLGL